MAHEGHLHSGTDDDHGHQPFLDGYPSSLIFGGAAVGLAIVRADELTIVSANSALAETLGLSRSGLLGRTLDSLCSAPTDSASLRQNATAMFSRGDRLVTELELRCDDGGTRWFRLVGAPLESAPPNDVSLWTLVDVTGRRLAEDHAHRLAFYDDLTKLPNRALLCDRLEVAIASSQRRGKRGAVVLLDLDDLKDVNDTVGRSGGDTLLAAVAERLRATVRRSDGVARLGGDEFVLLLDELRRPGLAVRAAERALGRIHEPFEIAGREIGLAATAGIAIFPDDGDNPDVVLRNASAAVHAAKKQARGGFRFFVPALNAEVTSRLAMERDLRRALDAGEFLLHYQPEFDLRTREVVGLEALVRWKHPTTGLVPPGRFIPVAEETGLIVPLGAWVLREACRQLQEFRERGVLDVPVAVNVSAVQFRRSEFAAVVDSALRDARLPPARLELEVTESVVMADVERVIASLADLRRRGLQLSIDDFGTGYSSLAYLKRLAVHKLKVDMSFVRGLPDDREDCAIVRAVVTLGHSLGLTVIAEGVETLGQLEFLAALGTDQIQGYLLGRPMPADELVRTLALPRLPA